MKGQIHMLEYVLMAFLVLLLIFLIVFFLTGWQLSAIESGQTEARRNRAEFLLRAFTSSPYINRDTYKEGSMFEDSKLTSVTCDGLQKVYGKGWFAEIESLEFEEECTAANYPLCGKWSYCRIEGRGATIFELPVNIYRKATGEIDIGILRVGLYG